MQRLPSVKTIARIESNEGDSVVIARRIRKVLERERDDSSFRVHDAMLACDEILNTCGIEAIESEDGETFYDDGLRFCPEFTYCNTGDTYATTVIRDHKNGRWLIASWGDLVEARPTYGVDPSESDGP